ncbi:MAG: glutamate-1-semialdehyde 2,1-aminomutase, partial [Planctomycetota bacterium]
YVSIIGRPSNLVFATKGPDQKPSQEFRTLLMQELIRHGILGTSLVVCYSHSTQDVAETVSAFEKALVVYKEALSSGVDGFLVGRPTDVVYRKFNGPDYSDNPNWQNNPHDRVS